MVNKLLLAGDKFISEIHLGQPGFACSACGTFFKKQSKNTKKIKETTNSRYIYQNKVYKVSF